MKSTDNLRDMELYAEMSGPNGPYYRQVNLNPLADAIEDELDEEFEHRDLTTIIIDDMEQDVWPAYLATCEKCGKPFWICEDYDCNYCPNCGRPIDGELCDSQEKIDEDENLPAREYVKKYNLPGGESWDSVANYQLMMKHLLQRQRKLNEEMAS